jgi:spore coat polysaccharide biosynthesis protein SpsF
MEPRIGIITQARMTSTRLPGKVMKEINQRSLLQYHTERLQKAGFDLAIATTVNETDNLLADFANQHEIKHFRGSEADVLSRFYETAKKFNFETIVRVTSDCPLIDPHLIRAGVEKYVQLDNPKLYLSNVIERTFARGFDFEIFSFDMLEKAHSNATAVEDLEHVTPYIWKNKSGDTEFYHVKQLTDNSDLRITVDTNDDYELIKVLISDHHASDLPYSEIEHLLRNHPELVALNASTEQKKI